MKEIELTQGKVTQVDDWNYEWLLNYSWHSMCCSGIWYAARTIQGKSVFMHREIMKTPFDLMVDHRDHDGLNNQEFNLRNCTNSINIQNRRSRDELTGIHWSKNDRKFMVRIQCNRKRYYLGLFTEVSEAVEVYNLKALELFGESARLNKYNANSYTCK